MTGGFKQSCFIDTNIFLRFLLADNVIMHEESTSLLLPTLCSKAAK